MHHKTIAVLATALLAACAEPPPVAPAMPVPDTLKPAPGALQWTSLAARGVQIYECRANKDKPAATEWAFVAPEADLFDAHGHRVGRHYAGPRWQSNDGSTVAGTVTARAEAPQAGAIPWLLLSTTSVGPNGAFAKVTSVQRIHTVGGVAPATPCDAAALGQTARVAYTADYVMFASP